MAFIETFIKTLMDFGIVEVLTLVMMITIVYAILAKSKLFGDPDGTGQANKRANAVSMLIAVVLGIMVFVSPIGHQIDIWFTKFFVHILIVLVVALGVFLVVGMAGHKFEEGLFEKKTMFIIALIIILIVFFNAGGLELFGFQGNEYGVPGANPLPTWNLNPEVISQLLGAFVVLGIFFGSIAMIFIGGKADKK